MISRRTFVIALLSLFIVAPGGVAHAQGVPAAVTAALKDPGRPPGDMAKDAERQPADVVAFSGIKAGDVVVDLVPGNGYYTRILSKLVGTKGKVYAYVPIVGNAQGIRARERAALAKGETPPPNPVDEVLAIQDIQPAYANVVVFWQDIGGIGVPEQVDAVVTVDAYHGIRSKTFGPADVAAVNAAVFRALKPGGVFYVVDDTTSANGAKDEVSPAGFVVDGSAKTIGTRVAYRFRKPASAPGDKRPKGDPIKSWYGNTFTLGPVTERFRTIFHHPDGTYQEFGMNDMQSGTWFWAADGRNCMLHQFPSEQRGFVTCHQYPMSDTTKPGDMWIEGGPNHLAPYKAGEPRPAQGQGNIVGLAQGYLYPNVAARGGGPGPAPAAAPQP